MADGTESAAPAAGERAPMTGKELHERVQRLAARISRVATREALILKVATDAVARCVGIDDPVSIAEIEAQAIEDVRAWRESGRHRVAMRRTQRLIERLDAHQAAVEQAEREGRPRPPYPLPKPRRRAKRRRHSVGSMP